EMQNMILEFKRIDTNWMFKIAQAGFSSRNKNLDSFIRIGKRALKNDDQLNQKNLFEYVENQIKVREAIVIPKIDNEIEYYERIVKETGKTPDKETIITANYSTFNFDFRKIREDIDRIPTYAKKKVYLLFLKKELKR